VILVDSSAWIEFLRVRELATVLHNDRDFETLARHSKLRLEPFVG
jgi:hypothetical protein